MEAVMRAIKLAHPVKINQLPVIAEGILSDVKATLDQCRAIFDVIEDDPDGSDKSMLMAQIGWKLTRMLSERVERQLDAQRGAE
jgi:hypothetical protein